MKERRLTRRVREKVAGVVTVISAPAVPALVNKSFPCLTADLSSTGVKINIHIHTPPKALLELMVDLPLVEQIFRRVGQVAWVESWPDGKTFSVGVEFTDSQRDVAQAWTGAVDKIIKERDKVQKQI